MLGAKRKRKKSFMPTDIRIIHAHEFVRATADGELDFETSKKALVEIALATAHLVDSEILLDTRKAKSRMSVTDLWYLAAGLSTLGKAFFRKTAVLCPVERFDYAEFFALCADNRGLRVQAFKSFEDAIDWLIGIEPDANTLEPNAEKREG
jgi:hypothetical protein